VLFVSVLHVQAIEVSPGGTHYVGDTLSFRPSNSAFGNAHEANWNFGDGTTYTTTSGMDTVTHSYSAPGSYTVTVVGQFSASSPITETVTVRIEQRVDNRYIEVEPDQPIVGQPATFRAFNFNTPEGIIWDMGDGTILGTPQGARGSNAGARFMGKKGLQAIKARGRLGRPAGTSVVTHTYSAPGNYTVRAYDFFGDTETPVTLNITARLPDRGITYSPTQPLAGAPVQFNAVNFLSSQIDWTFGDGTTVSGGSVSVTHVYNNAGTYTVTANETNSNYNPVSIVVTVTMPDRRILYQPQSPRVDQLVYFQTRNFLTSSIDWNLGDGTIITGGGTTITHRYQTQGMYTVSAKDSTINHTPITTTVNILKENRYITVSPPEVRVNETVTVQAFNFRGEFILWNFGDGTQRTGGQTETHSYTRAGTYTITARDENGESQVPFTVEVTVRGIDDEVNLEIAEIRLDNGKYYKVVSKNSKNIRAVLRMKMKGTGIFSGYWEVDGRPFEFFNEVVSQGLLKEIYTRRIPGIPTIEPGIHRITLRLTRPADLNVRFPVLKYFVLPYESLVKTLTPPDGFVAKDKEIPEFSWEEPRGANKYQIAFANLLYPIMNNTPTLRWIDVGTDLTFTPGEQTWNSIKRNRWTYWKVRALNTFGEVVAESDIMDIKVVIATAEISINKVTDLEGQKIVFEKDTIKTRVDDVLVHGSIEYKGESEYLVLRVWAGNELTDQLLFRDVKKGEKRYFETSVPHKNSQTRIFFQVLKTSSPAILVGIKNLILKK
jgi:PKD repeat protein